MTKFAYQLVVQFAGDDIAGNPTVIIGKLTAVPEPSAFLLLGGIGAVALVVRKRKSFMAKKDDK